MAPLRPAPHTDPLPASGARERVGAFDHACFPLPAVAHVPGTGTEPDRAPLEAAKALVRRPVTAAGWEMMPYRYGAALCLNGFFWEAHEVWEAVWLACPPNSREARFLRALIQLANAVLKHRMNRANAARRLFAEAEELVRDCRGADAEAFFMGVRLPELHQVLVDARLAAEAGESPVLGPLLRPLAPLAEPWTRDAYAL